MAGTEFKFRQVTILKETLGRGAYGVVHKAKCDELVCAAKYMHPIFFTESEGQHFDDSVANRFKKECELLCCLKHPNIVQYLGTHEESGINTVILLMEQLDTSLYAYLQEHKPHPLPFYLEINISLDVACALDYLHINGIHHRDLSCKNILMLGTLRAKVSDFGQSRLRDPKSGYSSNSPCPGNILYMPPEVLKIPPDFSETLDEFSFGVVMIQIMSRQDPQPTALHCPGTTLGTLVEVPEIERRKKDIDLCDPVNPILQLVISCISSNPVERSPIQKVCQLLSLLKHTTQHSNSVQGLTGEQQDKQEVKPESDADGFVHIVINNKDDYSTKKIDTLKRDNEDKEQLLKEQNQLLEIRNQQLVQKHMLIEKYENAMKEKENEVFEKEHQLQVHNEELATKEVEIVDRDGQLSELRDLLGSKEAEILDKEQHLIEKEEQLRRKEETIIAQRDQQTSSDERYSTVVTEMELLRAELASKNLMGSFPRISASSSVLTQSNGFSNGLSNGFTRSDGPTQPRQSRPSPRNTPRKPKQLEFNWKTKSQTPVSFQPQSSMAVACKDSVYVTYCNYSRSEGKIYEYNLSSDTWVLMPLIGKSEFSLAVINNDYIVAVGGSIALRKSSSILRYCYSTKKWITAFPDVPTPRSFPSCITVDGFIVVVGGEVNGEPISVAEIFDIGSNIWHYVLPLPINGLTRMTASVEGQFAYFLGGFEEGALSKLAFTVNVRRLITETEKREGRELWLKIPSLPVSGATSASFQNRILAIGGYNTSTRSSSDFIYEFDQIHGSWQAIGHLPRSFSRGLVAIATVQDQKVLVVIGGSVTDGISTATNVAYL